MNNKPDQIIKNLFLQGKGILADDDSVPTLTKRFAQFGIEATDDMRKAYRLMIFTTENINDYISGVILHAESVTQKTQEGVAVPQYLESKNIIPGVKVDQGLKDYGMGEKVTRDVDNLSEKIFDFKNKGISFTKWRTVFSIGDKIPSKECILENAEKMADFAYASLEHGLVPIVEPEVLSEGDYSIEVCRGVTEQILVRIFQAFQKRSIDLRLIILKSHMIMNAKQSKLINSPEEIADVTLECFDKSVPKEIAGIVFLSGGQSAEDATLNLSAICKKNNGRWKMTFSFDRALLYPALAVWKGDKNNISQAQEAFINRAKLNSKAVSV